MARADTVARPKKERAVPAAGQPFMAEPDFGTGQNVVLPFPLAQGKTYRSTTESKLQSESSWCKVGIKIPGLHKL